MGPAGAADFTMKIGFGTMNDIQHQWGTWMKEAIEARSQGRIEVKLFPRNQLGTIASQIEGLQLGTIEAFTTPTDFLPASIHALAYSAPPCFSRTCRMLKRCCSIPKSIAKS